MILGSSGIDVKGLANLANKPGASRTYRPRVRAFLTVPIAGTDQERRSQNQNKDTIELEFRVRKLRIEYNDHNMADTASIEGEYLDIGQDPRSLSNATIAIYVDEAQMTGGQESFTKTPDNLRFVGIATKIARAGSEDDGWTLKIDMHDYTQLFLEQKHYPPDKVPTYDMTLSEAWALICDNTGFIGEDLKIVSSVSALRTKIRFVGDTQDTVLASSVLPRFRKFGKVQVHPDKDAWAVWQQCCAMCGVMSFIRLDEVVVTTATNYYTVEDPPVLSQGQNIYSIHEDRNCTFVRKGIHVISYDPTKNSTIEAFYPPLRDPRVLKKAVKAKTLNGKDDAAETKIEQRDVHYYPAITDKTRLLEIAQRIYEEKARQELEGTLVTKEMRVKRKNSGREVDLLSLGAGDTVRVEFNPENRLFLKSLKSKDVQFAYLLEKGYTPSVAKYLVDNLAALDRWVPEFLIKRLVIEIDTDEQEGDFSIEINYLNHIQIDASIDPGY